MGDLKDRRLLVPVDGNDQVGVLHPYQVLDCTGDATGDVDLGAHGFSGLAHLVIIRHPPRVNSASRGAHRPTQDIGQFFQDFEVLRAQHSTAARD